MPQMASPAREPFKTTLAPHTRIMNTTAPSPTATANVGETPLRKPRYSTNGNEHAVVVNVELPGVAKDSISIDFDQNILSIVGQRKAPAPENWKPLYRELNDLGYALRLRLGSNVDESKLTAQFTDGVLTVTLPIRETAKPRRIEVN